jgi:hypothetical protein
MPKFAECEKNYTILKHIKERFHINLIVIDAKRRQVTYLQNLTIFKCALSSLKFENSQSKHQSAVLRKRKEKINGIEKVASL